jgi:hypothetical protein
VNVIIGEGFRELREGEPMLPTDQWCEYEEYWVPVPTSSIDLNWTYCKEQDWTTRRKRTESDDVFDRIKAATERPDWAEVLLAEVSADLRLDLVLIVREWMEDRT